MLNFKTGNPGCSGKEITDQLITPLIAVNYDPIARSNRDLQSSDYISQP